MKETNYKSLVELLGIDIDSPVVDFFESTVDIIPYVGRVYSSYKFNRLQKRVIKLESRLEGLSILMHENHNKMLNAFIREKAFPFVLNELLEEHEDEKVDLIMNGLVYVYKNDVREESKMLVYFDILRELRVEEIKTLLTYTSEYKKYYTRREGGSFNYPPDDMEERKKYFENKGYQGYIINHLEKLGLLDTGIRSADETYNEVFSALNDMARNASRGMRSRKTNKENKITITSFAMNFIKFFGLEIIYELPAE